MRTGAYKSNLRSLWEIQHNQGMALALAKERTVDLAAVEARLLHEAEQADGDLQAETIPGNFRTLQARQRENWYVAHGKLADAGLAVFRKTGAPEALIQVFAYRSRQAEALAEVEGADFPGGGGRSDNPDGRYYGVERPLRLERLEQDPAVRSAALEYVKAGAGALSSSPGLREFPHRAEILLANCCTVVALLDPQTAETAPARAGLLAAMSGPYLEDLCAALDSRARRVRLFGYLNHDGPAAPALAERFARQALKRARRYGELLRVEIDDPAVGQAAAVFARLESRFCGRQQTEIPPSAMEPYCRIHPRTLRLDY